MNEQLKFLNKKAKIKINGKEYSNINEIPPELIPEKFRKYLEDKDGNNIPDILDKLSKYMPAEMKTQNKREMAPGQKAIHINNFKIFKIIVIAALIGGLIYYFANNF